MAINKRIRVGSHVMFFLDQKEKLTQKYPNEGSIVIRKLLDHFWGLPENEQKEILEDDKYGNPKSIHS